MRSSKGTTFFELILVMAVLSIIAVPLFLSYTKSKSQQSLIASGEQFANIVRSAQLFSREARDERIWGVRYKDKNTYELVSGSADTWEVKQSYKLVTPTGFLDQEGNKFFLKFKMGDGMPDSESIIVLNDDMGRKYRVEILSSGLIESNYIKKQ